MLYSPFRHLRGAHERQPDQAMGWEGRGVYLHLGVGLGDDGWVGRAVLPFERDLGELRVAREDARAHLMHEVLDGLADELMEDDQRQVADLLGGDVVRSVGGKQIGYVGVAPVQV